MKPDWHSRQSITMGQLRYGHARSKPAMPPPFRALIERLRPSGRPMAIRWRGWMLPHKREIAEKLRLLNEELHDLNVQFIREGLSAKPS